MDDAARRRLAPGVFERVVQGHADGIFKGEHPAQRARAMVAACTHYQRPEVVARVSENLGKAMVGLLEHEDPVAVSSLRAQRRSAQ